MKALKYDYENIQKSGLRHGGCSLYNKIGTKEKPCSAFSEQGFLQAIFLELERI
jgi:hypothetical protein